jgi:kynureninase
VLALGAERIRRYALEQQQRLVGLLAGQGIAARGGREDHGAFVVVESPQAVAWREALAARAIVTDARGPYLRLCPDVVTTDAELVCAAETLASLMR